MNLDIIIAVVSIVLCIIVGMIGKKRNMSFLLAFFIALILSPLLGIIIVMLHKKGSPESANQNVDGKA